MIYIEANMKGHQHILANVGIYEAFMKKNCRNYLFCDGGHFRNMTKYIDGNSCVHIPIFVIKSGSFVFSIIKTLNEFLAYIFVFMFAKLVKDEIVILSCYASTKTVIEKFVSFFKVKAYVVHHGELDALSGKKSRYSDFVRIYFANRNSCELTDVFLAPSIADNVIKSLGRPLPSWISVLHPHPNPDPDQSNKKNKSENLHLAYFGSLTTSNRVRLQLIIEALNSRISRFGCQDFLFSVICPGASCLDFGKIEISVFKDTTTPLDAIDYENLIKKFDLAILPYKEKQYDFIASGVVADCRMYGIKFLVARSDFFTDWIAAYPDSGFLFNDFRQLINHIAGAPFFDKGSQ